MPPELHPPVRVLMGPGPSDTHPRVLQALAKGTVGHLDPYYLEVMNGLQDMLRSLFRTKNPMTFAVSGTGSAGMEATVVNLIEPGESMERILSRKTKVQSWYLDVSMLANYWGQNRVYHHTGPINMTYALYEALRLIHEEGLENCHARHMKNHRALRAGLAALHIKYSTQEGHILPQLNAVFVPTGVDDAAIRTALLNRFGIEIGAGLGAYKGKVWRIGLMGFGSRQANVLLFLSALEQLLAEQRYNFNHGASIAAANAVYAG